LPERIKRLVAQFHGIRKTSSTRPSSVIRPLSKTSRDHKSHARPQIMRDEQDGHVQLIAGGAIDSARTQSFHCQTRR
jgi:hypothetical protein